MEIPGLTIKFTPARKPLQQTQPTYPISYNILRDKKSQKKHRRKQKKLLLAQKAKSMNGDSGSISHLFHTKREDHSEKLEKFQNGSVNCSILTSPIKFVNGISEKLPNGCDSNKKLLNGSCNGSSSLPLANLNGNVRMVIKPSEFSISPTSNGARPLVSYSDSDSDSDSGGDSPAKVIVRSRIVSVRETTGTHSTLPACNSLYGSSTSPQKVYGPTTPPHLASKGSPSSPKKSDLSSRKDVLSVTDNQKPCSSAVQRIGAVKKTSLFALSSSSEKAPVAATPFLNAKSSLVQPASEHAKALLPNVLAKKIIIDVKKNTDVIPTKRFEGSKLVVVNGEKKSDVPTKRFEGSKLVVANGEKKPEFCSAIPSKHLENGSKLGAQSAERKIIGPSLPESSKLVHNGERKIIINVHSTFKSGDGGKLIRSESAPSIHSTSSLKRPYPSDGIKDGPLPQRKRVLSERGEEERKHPIIDRSVIAHWRWTSSNRIGHRRSGCGLLNFSNDCFLNSVMQIVIHSAPLAHFIYSHKYDPMRCRKHDQVCIMCRLRTLIHDSFTSNGKPIHNTMIKCTKQFFKSHRRGTQADAHEALLLLLDAIDGVALPGIKKCKDKDALLSKSTPSEQIFGMTLRYRGVCRNCGKDSNGYERVRVLELCMDKWRPTNTGELLKHFFKQEQLGDYKCEKCNARGNYSRRTQLLRAPAILILQIQRFSFMRKVKEEVIPLTSIDLQPFLVDGEAHDIHGPAQYTLKGVVDHLGYSIDSGHYRTYHVDTNGEQWLEFDDEVVQRMDIQTVRRQVKNGCYMLIYHRKSHA